MSNLPENKIKNMASRAVANDAFYDNLDFFAHNFDEKLEVFFEENRKLTWLFEDLFKEYDREAVLNLYLEKYDSIKAELEAEQYAKNVEEDSSVQDEKSTCHRCGEDMGPDDDECHSCELEFAKKYDY